MSSNKDSREVIKVGSRKSEVKLCQVARGSAVLRHQLQVISNLSALLSLSLTQLALIQTKYVISCLQKLFPTVKWEIRKCSHT